MKTKLLLLVAFLVAMALPGCKKDEAPVSSDKPINITTNPNGDTSINPGSTITINYEITGDVTMSGIKIDGVVVATSSGKSGEYTLENVMMAKTCVVFCESKTGKIVNKQILVTVKEVTIQTPVISYFITNSYLVENGKSVNLKWKTISARDSTVFSAMPVYLPRLVSDSIDSLTVTPTVTTVYTITGYNQGKSASKSITITVTLPPPTPTREDSLPGSYLKKEHSYANEGTTNFVSIMDSCEFDDVLKILATHRFEMHQGVWKCFPGLGELSGNGDWSLPFYDTFNLDGVIYTIVEFTSTKLVMTTPNKGAGGGTYKVAYERI